MRRYLALILIVMAILTGCAKEGEPEKYDKETSATDAALSGYVLETEKAVIGIGEEAQTATEQLGEPLSLNEAASCAFGDLDKIWTYNDFTIYSYQEDGVDYIYDIVLTSDAISTMEGICIGDTVDDVSMCGARRP